MAVMESRSCEVLGGVDTSYAARRNFQRAFGRPTWPSLSEYDGPAVDVVVIATPTETHVEVVKQALSALSPKILVCEKPVGVNASETQVIMESAERRGTAVVVNYVRQYLPTFREFRRRFRLGAFGDLTGGNVLYSHGLRRNGSHYVALLLWLLGDASAVAPSSSSQGSSIDPAFTLTFDKARVDFSSLGQGHLRAGEINLGFTNGLLKISDGGHRVSWSEIDDAAGGLSPSYGELIWSCDDAMKNYQLGLYDLLSSSSLSRVELRDDLPVALRAQQLMDEVCRNG